jgi:hypothetical protein
VPALNLPLTTTVLGSGGLCLDVANARSDNGTEIQIANCNDSAAQVWTLGADLSFQALGKCMDVATDSGPPMQLQDCDGGTGQRWTWKSGRIVNADSGFCLDVNGGITTQDRTSAVVGGCQGTRSQTWSLPNAPA